MRSGEFHLVVKFPIETKGLRLSQVESVAKVMQEVAKSLMCDNHTNGDIDDGEGFEASWEFVPSEGESDDETVPE